MCVCVSFEGVALLDGKPEDLPKIIKQMKEAAIQRRKQAMEEAKRQQQTALAVQSQNEI